MKEKILNVFFPRTCPVCGEVVKGQDKFVCDKCKGKVFYMKEPKCAKCGKSLKEDGTLCKDCREHKHAYEKGVCLFQYAGGIKESMYRFKYKNAREYGAYYGWETAKRYGKLFEQWGIDYIMAVPVSKKKEIKRGYNQAYVYAKEISRYTKIPMDKKCLVRVEDTKPQKEFVGIARKKNVENAFAIYEEKAKEYNKVLLVDDIYTTGSTIDACTRVLKAAGVKEVYFVCISAGVL